MLITQNLMQVGGSVRCLWRLQGIVSIHNVKRGCISDTKQLHTLHGNPANETTTINSNNHCNRYMAKYRGRNYDKEIAFAKKQQRKQELMTCLTEDITDNKLLVQLQVKVPIIELILYRALHFSKNDTETLFYENRLRVNGKKIPSFLYYVSEGDVIDIIKNFYPDDPQKLVVSRIELLNITTSREKLMKVATRIHKSLIISNYSNEDIYKVVSLEV